jgi:uncharacterized protein (TIGR02145 family)
MQPKVFFLLVILFLFTKSLVAQFNPKLTYGTVKDIDGNTYKTIKIGTQIWMAENLRTTKYRNGSLIANITSDAEWLNTASSGDIAAWSYFNNDVKYNIPYGKLYNWYAVSNSKQICPMGWHMPTDEEWTTLSTFLGGDNIDGGKMKSTGTKYWLSPNTDATNNSGFSGLPGGFRNWAGSFYYVGEFGYWWSSTGEDRGLYAYSFYLGFGSGNLKGDYSAKIEGFSVRCVRD